MSWLGRSHQEAWQPETRDAPSVRNLCSPSSSHNEFRAQRKVVRCLALHFVGLRLLVRLSQRSCHLPSAELLGLPR